MFAPNCPEYATVVHGSTALGVVLSTFNPSYTETELKHQLKDSGAKVMVRMFWPSPGAEETQETTGCIGFGLWPERGFSLLCPALLAWLSLEDGKPGGFRAAVLLAPHRY